MAGGYISETVLEQILSGIDIVGLISSYIPLKRAGRNFKALCPFHHEKTSSFVVSQDKQIYHCFGCGAGGNAFNFLMQYERLEFLEAVEALAKKAGVSLPEKQKTDSPSTNLTSQLHKTNELAASFFEQCLRLPQAQQPRNYLAGRGLKEETLKLFRLGVTFDNWDGLIAHLRSKGISLSLLEKSGLVLKKESGGYYDRFRNRIIFPILDIKSRVIAFGARQVPVAGRNQGLENMPKYVNSPETPIYVKGRNLYGLHLAKDAIRESDCLVIVEGYLDLIIPYQEGLHNIVASLGTALTTEQIRLIKRYTNNVVMVYDADMAGQLATMRALDMFIDEGINVKVASLPVGLDPDTSVRQHGIENFKDRIMNAESIFDYKIRMLESRYPIKTIEGKAMISSEMLATIHKFKNAVLKSEYIKKLAGVLDVEEDALWQEAEKIKEEKIAGELTQGFRKIDKPLPVNPTEKLLINLMLEETEFISRVRDNLEPADFQDERVSRIVASMFELLAQGKHIGPSSLVNLFGEESISRLICESSVLPEMQGQDKEKVLEDCLERLKKRKLVSRKHLLHKEIKKAQDSGDEENLLRLMHEFDNLLKKR